VEIVPESEVKVFAVPSGIPVPAEKMSAGSRVLRDLREMNDMLKKSVAGRKSPKNSSGSSGGEDLESTLEPLVEMTS
jgi:hypothetical protein